MKLLALWLHVLAIVVWMGGLMYQAHVLLPAARAADLRTFAEAARRGRSVAWTALALAVLTGFYNVTQLGPLERVMQSGAGLMLAGKFILVLAVIAIAGQRDFAQVPRLAQVLATNANPAPVVRAIAWLDRLALVLAMVIVYLGLAVSRV